MKCSKVFKLFEAKKEEKHCKFNVSLTFTYCRRPESVRSPRWEERPATAKRCICLITTVFLLWKKS